MAIIRFLGTGSGYPHPDRGSSSVLVEGTDGALLIDAGEGCARRLAEEVLWKQEIRTILLTHAHADHSAGLPMLLNGMKADRRTSPLELIAPMGLLEGWESFLPAIRLGEDRLTFPLELRELKPGRYNTSSGHKLDAWTNDHLPADREGRGGSYSLAVEIESEKWVFSGDLGSLEPLEGKLDRAAGLVVETRHVDPNQAVQLAKKAGIGTILLTHISADQDTPPIDDAIWAWDNLVVYTRDSGKSI
ncbi:MBL fold metallo-hydrolase [bacterium]|nr:MBL fold metallo-hydrolase [bacterium]